ncbi:hypothetical protein, conserved [Plasmodium gonderi]|uniref:Uncharacterized protein n=1 Tax=Plasmodium gonderi TaxID=77519 RepID=A0A1Y1JG09_PLAGO|nr:hypothetical protein, conserved [Plasmodium gonderi]GAW80147.1 hypothetical protein, conserved [Plasmodium gonderi]
MTRDKENVINCRRLHRANMIFATISNNHNYICIITHYENTYNLELFSTINQMQKIFRKSIPDNINKVYINDNDTYICATSQNGSLYILDMKGNIVHKNEKLHCLYRKKKDFQRGSTPLKIGYSKRKRKKETTSIYVDQENPKKDSIPNENDKKKFKTDKIVTKDKFIESLLNNNKEKPKSDKLMCAKSKLTWSGKNGNIKNKALTNSLVEKVERNKKITDQNGITIKSGITLSKLKTKGCENCEQKCAEKCAEKRYKKVILSKPQKDFNINMSNDQREESSEPMELSCDTNDKKNENEKQHPCVKTNLDSFEKDDFTLKKNLRDDYIIPSVKENRSKSEGEKRELNSNKTEYENFPLEVVDIYWIGLEKEGKNNFPENNTYHSFYNFFDVLHIIYSVDIGLNIICSINLKIIIYKYNILDNVYNNINSFRQLKDNIVHAFMEEFIKKCKSKNKQSCLRYIKLGKYNCYRTKMNNLNTSLRRINNYRCIGLLNTHNDSITLDFCPPYYLDLKEHIVKKIFNDLIIDIKQSYVSDDQLYILVNYYVHVKRKHLKFSSLEAKGCRRSIPEKENNQFIQTNEQLYSHVENSKKVASNLTTFHINGNISEDKRKSRYKKFNVIKMLKNREKTNELELKSHKKKICLLGIQRISYLDKEFKSVKKIVLYLQYSFSIVHNIFHIYKQMSSIYTKCNEYKKLHKKYESILQLNEHFKRFYYRDRTLIYFSKYMKNRKENFDEKLYNLFFKKNEKRDFARYYEAIKKMINENTVCCTCSKERFLIQNSNPMNKQKKDNLLRNQPVECSSNSGRQINGITPFTSDENEPAERNCNDSLTDATTHDGTKKKLGSCSKSRCKSTGCTMKKEISLNNTKEKMFNNCKGDSVSTNGRSLNEVPSSDYLTNVMIKESKVVPENKKGETNCLQRMVVEKEINGADKIINKKNNCNINNVKVKEKKEKEKYINNKRQFCFPHCRTNNEKYRNEIYRKKEQSVHRMCTKNRIGDSKNRANDVLNKKRNGIVHKQMEKKRLDTIGHSYGDHTKEISSCKCCFSGSGNNNLMRFTGCTGKVLQMGEKLGKKTEEKEAKERELAKEEEVATEENFIPLSEGEMEEQFLKSRKFIVPIGQNICNNCEILIEKKTIHNYEKLELNYEIPKKNKKINDEEIYSSLIKDVHVMYGEKNCPINILLLLQEFSEKELERCMVNFQMILNYYEKVFLENINEHLKNLFKIVNICKTLSNNIHTLLKKYSLDKIKKLYELIIYCVEMFQTYYNLQTHLHIFLFLIKLLLFISKNIYFEKFPHYKEAFSNFRSDDMEIFKNYNFIKGYKKIHFNYFDEYLHNNYVKTHKFYVALCEVRLNLIHILQIFDHSKRGSNRRRKNNNSRSFPALYNISILSLQNINQFNYFTLPKNTKKDDSVQNFSYFDNILYKNSSIFYPFYVCTCDRFSFLCINKYYQSDFRFKLIQKRTLGITLYPLTVLNIVVISKNLFYIFTKNDRTLNVTLLKVKYEKLKRNTHKSKREVKSMNNLSVLKCSNLESYYPSVNTFDLKIQSLCDSIIANCEPHMCMILEGS